MKIGVPKEIKTLEFRVGLVPPVVHQLTVYGHKVFVETGAGAGIGQSDEDYRKAGAEILPNADEVFKAADMIVKVKEPQAVEIARLKPHHILFTYLHLAPDPEQTKGLMKSGATCIAYETITDAKGRLPLLAPMSQVAGRMATQVGAALLLKPAGGRGMLLGGVPGVLPAKVVVLGGGVSGTHAAEMAVGMRADVTLFDISPARLEELDVQFDGRLKTVFSTHHAVAEALTDADLVIGCVLLPGAAAPKLVKREDLKRMQQGLGAGGCRHRSGRLFRDQPSHHPCRAHLRGRWHHPLLRRQYARRSPTHLDLCAQRRHCALCLCIGQQRRGCGAGGRQRFRAGPEREGGQDHPSRRRRSVEALDKKA